VPADAPDIVLISIDCLRIDALGAYGGPKGLTPVLDELAADGIVFERPWAVMATTHPSHTTMMTGLYPRYHGVRWNGDVLREDVQTLAEQLQEHGYRTGAFVAYKAMLYRAGLDRGFEGLSDRKRTKVGTRPDEEVVAMAVDWLAGAREGDRVFLWVHLFDPHSPYELTEHAREELLGYEGPLAQGASQELLREQREFLLGSSTEVAALRVLYDGEVAAVDAHVGQILGELRRSGRLGNSVVVVTGDHGESLGEGGRIGHGPRLDEILLRTPLIVRDFRSDLVGFRVPTPVGHVDLTPTLLEIGGLDLPEGLQGRSLASTVLDGEEPEPGVYFAEVNSMKKGGQGGNAREDTGAAYWWPYKLVRGPEETSLWVLSEAGVVETRVVDGSVELALRERLDPLLDEYLDEWWYDKPTRALDEQDLAELRSLGYIQ